jgi:trigger factor
MAVHEKKYDAPATKRYSCEITLDEVNVKAETELMSIANTAEIKGFRKGHAPMKMIKELYFTKAYNMAIETIIKEEIEKIAKSENFKLASSPSVKMNDEEKEKIAFEITFELLPEIPYDFDFSQIKATSYEVNLTEEEIQKELQSIAEKNRIFSIKEGRAEKGDIVVIDFVGRVDGVEFAGGKMEGHELELGSGSFIPGFEDQLIGSSADESVIVTVTFPTDYHAKDLAGKEAQFFTKVKAVKSGTKAEVNDDLAQRLSFTTIEDLLKEMKLRIAAFYENAHKENLKSEIFESLSKALSFEVGEEMVSKVAKSIVEEKKLPEEEIANLTDEAKRRLRLSFFLNHIASEQKITITEQDFTNFIIQNSSLSEMNPFQMLEFYSKNKEAKRRLELLLEENKIYDFIFERVSITKEKISKEEFDKILKIEN